MAYNANDEGEVFGLAGTMISSQCLEKLAQKYGSATENVILSKAKELGIALEPKEQFLVSGPFDKIVLFENILRNLVVNQTQNAPAFLQNTTVCATKPNIEADRAKYRPEMKPKNTFAEAKPSAFENAAKRDAPKIEDVECVNPAPACAHCNRLISAHETQLQYRRQIFHSYCLPEYRCVESKLDFA